MRPSVSKDALRTAGGYPELPPEALSAYDMGGEIGLMRFLNHVPEGFFVCPGDRCGEEPPEACGLCDGVGLLCVAGNHPTHGPGKYLSFAGAREQLDVKEVPPAQVTARHARRHRRELRTQQGGRRGI